MDYNKFMRYQLNDPVFQEKLKEAISRGGIVTGKFIEGSRSCPAAIEELHGRNTAFVLTNDSRYDGGKGHRNRLNFRYSYVFGFSDNYSFECDFAGSLSISENPAFIGIDFAGRVGTFSTMAEIAEYIRMNPKSELKFYAIANEVRPKIEVKFT